MASFDQENNARQLMRLCNYIMLDHVYPPWCTVKTPSGHKPSRTKALPDISPQCVLLKDRTCAFLLRGSTISKYFGPGRRSSRNAHSWEKVFRNAHARTFAKENAMRAYVREGFCPGGLLSGRAYVRKGLCPPINNDSFLFFNSG